MIKKVAIIGIGCLFPEANNPEEYWQNLIAKRDLTSLATAEQMGVDPNIFYDRERGQPDKYYCRRGGYIRDFEFDPTGYQIAPEILQDLDPLYQWSLYTAKQALEDSGYFGNSEVLAKCGAILGNLSFPTRYSHHLFAPIYHQAIELAIQKVLNKPSFRLTDFTRSVSAANGNISSYPATLIAQALSLKGVNFCLDAACASSLYSIKLACDYLLAEKTDLMLAGAVSAADPLFINMGFSIFHAYPENEQSFPLNSSSEGLIAGEGAGIVVLKRYQDALRDNDRIYATIDGVGLSNDGKGKFILQPNHRGQILAFERAYTRADLSPDRINYIECHATGTPVGDIVELNSMASFFGKYHHSPLLGSVKANLGHLLTAAGIASLIKVVLGMNKGLIPPTINISEPLHSQDGNIGGDRIVTELTTWNNVDRCAAVSAFGFGGCNAHLILEDFNLETNAIEQQEIVRSITHSKLAIVGMDAVFGGCDGLEAFDRTIYEGEQHFISVPPQRWQGIEGETELLKSFGFVDGQVPKGAYIQDFDFDFLRYKIPPKEEDRLIPQQLLMLKVADRAIQDAQIQKGANVAIIIAMETDLSLHQYRGRVDLSWQIQASLQAANIYLTSAQIEELETLIKDSLHSRGAVNQYTSFIGNIMASRIAALWDFTGAAFTISAAENSVFKALEVAELMLNNGEVSAVAIGAIDLAGGCESVFWRQQQEAINRRINTLSFDLQAQGWLVGEGAGAIVVKSCESARRDNNRIYGIVDTISFVHHPSEDRSAASVQAACQKAFESTKIAPQDIGYLEVCGSGFVREDRAEIEGILQAYSTPERGEKSQDLTCCIGSIKANIGHTFAAAGIASLIKTALCLTHRYIPATPNWSQPKDLELWQDSPFYVAPESKTWFLTTPQSKRIAAINSLGSDGSYVHLIISEDVNRQSKNDIYLQQNPFYVFIVCAHDHDSLILEIDNFKKRVTGEINLAQLAYHSYLAWQQNTELPYKLTILGHNRKQVLKEINLAVQQIDRAFTKQGEWTTPLGSYFTPKPLGKLGKIAFVFPGMGSTDVGLGKDILRLFPQIYETFSDLATDISQSLNEQLLYPRSLTKLSPQLQAEKRSRFFGNGVAMCQGGISLATLYTLVLQNVFKIQPQVAFGYSLGEASAMLFALGIWHDRYHAYASSAAAALSSSSLFSTELCGDCLTARKYWQLPLNSPPESPKIWTSYLLKAPISQVKQILSLHDRVYLTFINTAQEVVIAGNPQECLQVIDILKCDFWEINFDSVLHSPLARLEYDRLIELHTMPIQSIPKIDFYSAIECQPLQIDRDILAQNSAEICCQTVDFPTLVNQVYRDGTNIFIEVGTKNNCTQWIKETLKDANILATAISNKGVDDQHSIIRVIAKLISHNIPIDASPLYPDTWNHNDRDKSILKKVILGRLPIQTAIFNPDNHQKFITHHQTTMSDPQAIFGAASGNENRTHQNLKIAQLQIAVAKGITANALQAKDRSTVIWNEADLLEFAGGKIANVFGAEYQIIDTYSRRVRLPLPPYLLVSRVTKLFAERGKFQPSTITTEYDIPIDAWYTVDRQVPWAITVESGQCDLLLISYLGIDFENQGDLVYRLLDCTLTFLDELPQEGDTLRYDIKINSFVRSGENLLFFFSYECFCKDRLIIKMDGGCAGFFSDEQLEQGKGIIISDRELARRKQIQQQKFEPLLVCYKFAFDNADIIQLTQGNLAGCFGRHYHQYGLNPSLRLPSEKILMFDRITSVNPTGGDWGLGSIIAEKDLEPEHWYFPCHFQDDQVLAGSLMAEGCSQILQFYLLYLGLHISTNDARFQPIYGLPQIVRCRGQVTPISAKLIYQVEITEIGLYPHPYAKCNVDIILQDKTIVNFQDLGLQLVEKSPNFKIDRLLTQIQQNFTPSLSVLIDYDRIQEFCLGSLATCFGSEYEIYDNGTVTASRMPNTHLNLVHRIVEVKGSRHNLAKGSTILTEYDVPTNPWYYSQNSSPNIPYSILMEIALQPCGFLSAYLGTTFLYPDEDLYFRNLDGKGTLLKSIDVRGKTITNTATLLSSSSIQGTIIQSFSFQVAYEGEIFYQGEAVFGHFSSDALAKQIGLDRGHNVLPWLEMATNLAPTSIDLDNPIDRHKYYQIQPDRPHYRLAQYQLDLLNEINIIPGGGQYRQGYIYATKYIEPTDWYFRCHFYQDPVMPGSLGLEAMLQAMQAYLLDLDLGKQFPSPQFTPLIDTETTWKYRGQIPYGSEKIFLEIHISKIEITPNRVTAIGDASLWKPSMRIYEVKNLGICLKNYNN